MSGPGARRDWTSKFTSSISFRPLPERRLDDHRCRWRAANPQRYRHYQRLLTADGSTFTVPELGALDHDAMDKPRFSSTSLPSGQSPTVALTLTLGEEHYLY